jgi:thiol-disulfide isomerase/thioredoxin
MKKYVAISVSFLVLAGFFMPSVSFAADTVPPELQGIMEQLKASLASLKANENTQSGSAASMASFAQCIEKSGAKFYGASWCPHCQSQKALFGQSAGLLPYTECSINNGAGVSSLCLNKSITAYPTWDFKDGTRKTGTQSLAALAQATGCVAPEKSTQFVEIKVPQTIIQITAPAMGTKLGFGRSFKVLWNEKDSAPKSFLMGVKNGNGETTYPGKAIRTKSGTYTWKNPSFMKKAGDYTLEFYKVPEKGKIPTEVIATTKFTVVSKNEKENKKITVDVKVNGSDHPKVVGPVSADLNFDKKVDSADLGLLASQWGPCVKGSVCSADLDLDNNVGDSDMAILIKSWGNVKDVAATLSVPEELKKISIRAEKVYDETESNDGTGSYGYKPFGLAECEVTTNTLFSDQVIWESVGKITHYNYDNATCVSEGVIGKVVKYAISVPFINNGVSNSNKSWCIDNSGLSKQITGSITGAKCS